MIRSTALALIVATLAGPAAALPAKTPAAALAGRVAGKPIECLPIFGGDTGSQTFDSGDILFRGRGSTVYLNTPPDCGLVRSNRIVITSTPTRLCRGDIAQIHDQIAPTGYGACALGPFVPYDRVRK